jgi:hypothetical protein
MQCQEVRETIETILLYGYDETFAQLLLGLREWAWANDFDFASQCYYLILILVRSKFQVLN